MPFELKARIGLDNSGLISGIEQSKAAVRSFGSAAKSHLGNELNALKGQFAAAFGLGALTGAIRGAFEYADAVDSVRTKLSLTSTEAQRMMYVADRTGSSVTQVLRAMGKDAQELLLTTEQVKEIMGDFDASGLAMTDEQIDRLDMLGDKAEDIAMFWRKALANQGLNFEEAFGGTLANIGLIIEGLSNSYLDRVNNKGNAQFNTGSELIAQGILGGDEEYAAIMDEQKRLLRQFNEKLKAKVYDPFAEEDAFLAGLQNAKPDVQHEISELKGVKEGLTNAFARQFDSLAKIGGFGQNTDQIRNEMARQVLANVQGIYQLLLKGNYGTENMLGPLL